MIYAVRRRLPGNNFEKEEIRVQLQLLDPNFDFVTVYGAMDIFHVKEYFLSLSQGQRSHFSSSFSSFLQRMLHRRDCSLCYEKLLAHRDAAGTSELSHVAARSQGMNRCTGYASSVNRIHWRVGASVRHLCSVGLYKFIWAEWECFII